MTRRFHVIGLIFILLAAWVPLAPAQDEAAQSKLTILLSNDDGYDAPGIIALAEAFSSVAKIMVAAPATEQSGTGHGITYREPIMVNQVKRNDGIEWYAIAARPATCVQLGLTSLMTAKPDLVISGINRGENLGVSTFLSGTCGAARAAALEGMPAIAVSMGGNKEDDYKACAAYIRRLVEQLQSHNLLRPGLFLNINVPAGVASDIKGTRITKLSLKGGSNTYERRTSPRGQIYFWNVYQPVRDDAEGTDVHAFAQGFITITPMSLDQTSEAEMGVFRFLSDASAAKAIAR